MFKLFKKSENPKEVLVVENPTKREYPQVVDDIHNEFFTAGDNILEEATCLLKELEVKDLCKGRRLAALGFGKTMEAAMAIEAENKYATTKEIADSVRYYRMNYPNNKFITEEQVKQICEKYGLIFGETSLYKGFVPEEKVSIIEQFKVKESDMVKEIWSRGIASNYLNEFLNDGGISASRWTSLYKKEEVIPKLKICAPLKDMEISGKSQVIGYKIQDVPDPVVLQPVKNGYLIVCAWGDEASDENVVNEKLN